MRKIFEDKNYRVYLINDYADIMHIELLLTRYNENREDLVVHTLCTYEDSLYIYEFNTLKDFTITFFENYKEALLKALRKYLKNKLLNFENCFVNE